MGGDMNTGEIDGPSRMAHDCNAFRVQPIYLSFHDVARDG